MSALEPGGARCWLKLSLFPTVAVAVGLGLAVAGPAAGAASADGQFDIDDLLLLMDWLDGAPPEPPTPGTPVFLATDVNKDSLIDWTGLPEPAVLLFLSLPPCWVAPALGW